jgi:hypothetical protein
VIALTPVTVNALRYCSDWGNVPVSVAEKPSDQIRWKLVADGLVELSSWSKEEGCRYKLTDLGLAVLYELQQRY